MATDQKIFNFNHISKNLADEKIKEIKDLYKYYHKQFWCYKKSFQHYQKMHLSTNLGSAGLVVIGSIAGGITLNPIILGSISGTGVLLHTYATAKKYDCKLEIFRFAYTGYFNILSELRNSLRSGLFNESLFFIIDNCPTISDKIMKKYDKKFIVKSTNKADSNIFDNHAKSFWI